MQEIVLRHDKYSALFKLKTGMQSLIYKHVISTITIA